MILSECRIKQTVDYGQHNEYLQFIAFDWQKLLVCIAIFGTVIVDHQISRWEAKDCSLDDIAEDRLNLPMTR